MAMSGGETDAACAASGDTFCSNCELIVPYFFPYAVYVVSAKLFGRFGNHVDYSLRIVLVAGCLVWAWQWYGGLLRSRQPWRSLTWGAGYGIVGCFVWVAFLYPFVEPQGEPWGMNAFLLRLVAATFLVPLFEEILVRGYLLRTAYQYAERRKGGDNDALANTLNFDSLETVPPGAWNGFAILFSSVAFSLGHGPREWPAAFVYSLLISVVWIHRKDLFACIVTHATTNLLLGLFVLQSGQWGFW